MTPRGQGRQNGWMAHIKGNHAPWRGHVRAWSTGDVPEPIDANYGETFADVYDDWYGAVSDVGALTALIDRLLEGGLSGAEVIECGVGTGRVALSLARAGALVTGIDNSESMLARLRANDPEGVITALLGDMGCELPKREFAVAVVAFNTLFNLQSEDQQRHFFNHVASRLLPGGLLFIEANEFRHVERVEVESEQLRPGGSTVQSRSQIDPTSQTASGEFDDGSTVRPWRIRYLSTTQIDDMATEAGLSLVQRTEDAIGTPFTELSERHVSVFRRPILEEQ